MDKSKIADCAWKITAAAQIVLIAAITAVFLTDPNGMALDKTIDENTPCQYYGGEIVYLIERGEMTNFTSAAVGISMILFAAAEIGSVISVVFSGRKSFRKIIRIILDLFNGFIFTVILALLTIPYDDKYYTLHPYDNYASFHEYNDNGRIIVICDDWFQRSGNTDIYFVDNDYNAEKVYSFQMYDDMKYETEFPGDGINVVIHKNDNSDETVFIPYPEGK